MEKCCTNKVLSKQLRMEKFLKTSLGKISAGKWLHKRSCGKQECCRNSRGKFLCRTGLQKRKWKKGCTNKVLSKQLRMEKFLKTSLGKISAGKWLRKKGAAENKNAAETAAANFSAGQGCRRESGKRAAEQNGWATENGCGKVLEKQLREKGCGEKAAEHQFFKTPCPACQSFFHSSKFTPKTDSNSRSRPSRGGLSLLQIALTTPSM